jgi:ligand-binding sensor domain-containing protein
MMQRPYATLLLLAGICALISCSNLSGVGGGSDVGNGIVSGRLENSDGTPAAASIVTLVPYLYNPATDACISSCLTDTTDASGSFMFSLTDNGTYNIQAMNPATGANALVTEIQVRLNYTLTLPQQQLSAPGSITVFLPESIDTVTGYLFIQGTTLWIPLSKAKRSLDGEFRVLFDSVPATTVPPMKYVHYGATVQSVLLSDSISVTSNSVSVVDAFINWKHYTTLNSPLPSDTIRDIIALPDGSQWFATAEGAVRVINHTWKIFSAINSPLPANDVFEISYENNSTVWFATSRGAASLGAGQWTVFNQENSGLPSNHVTDILIDPRGKKWFSTSDSGLVKYDGFSWMVHNSNNSPLPNTIHCMTFEDKPDLPGGWTLWCATSQGAAVFNGAMWILFSTQNSGILENAVNCLTIDHAGNKWFGHKNGLSLFSKMTWTVFPLNAVPGLTSPVTAIAEDNNGTMWFGTQSGVIKYNGTTWVKCTGERYRLLENSNITSLFIDTHDNKWIGTADNGIIVFGPDAQPDIQNKMFDK